MSVEMRILTCRLLEKMKANEAYGKRLGLEDASRVHVDNINRRLLETGAKGLAEKG